MTVAPTQSDRDKESAALALLERQRASRVGLLLPGEGDREVPAAGRLGRAVPARGRGVAARAPGPGR